MIKIRKEYKNFYHRYFEGFTEEKVPQEHGKGSRVIRTYTGFYYRALLTKYQRVGIRCLYTLLYVGAAFLLFHSAMQAVTCNSVWYCALPTGLSLFFLIWMAIPFCSYTCARENMTVYQFKSTSVRLKKHSTRAAAALGVTAAAALIATLLIDKHNLSEGIWCAAGFALAALTMLCISFIERNVKYLQVTNANGADYYTEDMLPGRR